jgi:hypothetical protein
LRGWFKRIRFMMVDNRRASVRQVRRYMGFGSYETAWSMCRRIRVAFQDPEFRRLMGVVEVSGIMAQTPQVFRSEATYFFEQASPAARG